MTHVNKHTTCLVEAGGVVASALDFQPEGQWFETGLCIVLFPYTRNFAPFVFLFSDSSLFGTSDIMLRG